MSKSEPYRTVPREYLEALEKTYRMARAYILSSTPAAHDRLVYAIADVEQKKDQRAL